jgi:hypothetical protein
MALRKTLASYSVANLSAPGIIPIDIPLENGVISEIGVYIGADMDGGDATFNFRLNAGPAPLFTGTDRWIIPDGDLSFEKTGLSLAGVRGDYLVCFLEELSGGTVIAPIIIIITYDDGEAITGAEIHSSPSKTTPADADEFGGLDSAASFALKKFTWANLKAAAQIGLLDDRGNYDASGNTFPSSGGSGAAGAILKGDLWTISVAGTLGGHAVTIGDIVRALVDTPGSTDANWAITENNFGYVAENSANKDTDGTLSANSDTKYASQKAAKTYADTKVSKTGDENIAGVKTFASSPVVPDPTATQEATSKNYVDAAVASVTGGQPSISALVSGGIVSWVSALTFQVSAAVYYIQGVLYNSAAQQITLDAADATDDRIDVLVLDTSSDFVKITGTPASEPNEPDYDPATQLKLTFVIVPATATEPENVVSDDVYLENTEWTSSTSGSGFNAASTSNPFAGSKDVEGTSVANGAFVQFSEELGDQCDDFNVLAFYIRSKAAWGSNRFLRFQFYLSGVAKGSPVTVKTGFWGFDDSNTASYQFVAIPLTQFVIPPGTQIDRIRITGVGSGGSFGFYIDNISIRNTGGVVTTTQGITEAQADVRNMSS